MQRCRLVVALAQYLFLWLFGLALATSLPLIGLTCHLELQLFLPETLGDTGWSFGR